MKKRTLKTALIYLAVSLFCVLFGAVYEIFSHGVYSGFMMYAFLFPLVGGTLPWLITSYCLSSSDGKKAEKQTSASQRVRNRLFSQTILQAIYHCGIIALTVGSVMKGVLDIYGTTNRLTSCYWIIGAALILFALVFYGIDLLRFRRRKTVS